MPLNNFLELNLAAPPQRAQIKQGDLVFNLLFVSSNGDVGVNAFAHVGIAADDAPDHDLSDRLMVYHLGQNAVELDSWDHPKIPAAHVSGTLPESMIDDVTRAAIIDCAKIFYQKTPSILAKSYCCYFMGVAHPNSHPVVTSAPYGFSCATFAYHCYETALPKASMPIVATDIMPMTSKSEYDFLKTVFATSMLQKFPFRRLYPSYLMGAFETDLYPFNPSDWEPWKRHDKYIPSSFITKKSTVATVPPPVAP